jgi:hypothetical protein
MVQIHLAATFKWAGYKDVNLLKTRDLNEVKQPTTADEYLQQ